MMDATRLARLVKCLTLSLSRNLKPRNIRNSPVGRITGCYCEAVPWPVTSAVP